MNMETSSGLSRREWLGRMSVPAIATVGAGWIGATPASAQSASSAAEQAKLGARVYNVREFGGKGDGESLDTKAVQDAIDACHRDNGGIVLVPAGDFVIGTLELKSNVTLHLATKGRLLGSKNRGDYLNRETMIERGVPPGNGNVVLMFAAKAQNITIEGYGTIDGHGAAYYTGKGDGTAPAAVRSQDPDAARPNVDRPHLMIFKECSNLRMRDVFLTASAYHGVRILDCNQISFDGVRIYNRVNLNNDGFHFNNCEYVQVSNCEIRCQDDACALFGSNKWVTITNCTFSTRWSIFRFGGGRSENIAISNCLIYETYGCPVKISAGRSHMEHVSFSNIVMKDVTGPISIAFSGRGNREPAPDDPKPFLRNISFNGIRATVVPAPVQHADMPFPPKPYNGEQHSCLTLNAFGEAYLENISFTDVHIIYAGGGTAELAAKRDVPLLAAEYFGVWGKDQPFGPPAYGMYARNVKGLTMHNVRFEFQQPDVRPAVIFDNVRDASLVNVSAQGNPGAESVLRFVNSQDVLLAGARVLTPAAAFLRLEGDRNQNIIVDGGDVSKAARPLDVAAGAKADAVKLRV